MSAVSQRGQPIGPSQRHSGPPRRRSPPMLWVSILTMAPDGRSIGALSGISASIRPSSSDVSRMFGTLASRSQTLRLASANTPRNQSTTSSGICGQDSTSPSLASRRIAGTVGLRKQRSRPRGRLRASRAQEIYLLMLYRPSVRSTVSPRLCFSMLMRRGSSAAESRAPAAARPCWPPGPLQEGYELVGLRRPLGLRSGPLARCGPRGGFGGDCLRPARPYGAFRGRFLHHHLLCDAMPDKA